MYIHFIKPFFDFLIAFVLLVILSPVIVFVELVLIIANQQNPFFIQPRPGKNGKIFKLIKFRTMADKLDNNENPLPDRERITKAGRIIRGASLDELLQLVNVLKGDMSLVGPRPLLVKYLPLYTKGQARRHEVKPGITGWAQVNGRNALTWNEKFKLDVWYVDNVSLSLDIRIIMKTILKVLRREGINASENHTMQAFNGRN